MFKWVPYPFLRLTPPFIAGILLNIYFNFQINIWFFAVLLSVYALITFFTPRKYKYQTGTLLGMLGIIMLLLAGTIRTYQFSSINHPNHIMHDTAAIAYYSASVIEPTSEKKQSFQTSITVEKVFFEHEESWKERVGKILIYQSKNDSSEVFLLKYGDKIIIKNGPGVILPPTNPGQFDYGNFLSFQNIYHQQFIKANEIVKFGHHPPNWLMAFAYRMQKKCSTILDRNVKDFQSKGIAQALILGVKDGLDNQIREAYAAAGAMHVLAVSGLHVGIIYLIVSFLFSFVKKLPGGKWLHAVLCLLAVWMYALVTGLSPSVLRSATMFSFIIVAAAGRKQTNIYNTLAASSLFLLCIDPFLIVSVGFQLSYLAVTGIVYLQPKIYKWFAFDHWLPDKIWQLTAVSIAAQVATFPLGLYYFHQFPVYFWLANLLVIPAAFLILSVGLLTLLAGSLWSVAGTVSGAILDRLIWITNQGVLWIEKLPYSIIAGWVIDEQQTILIYGFILCILLFFHYRKFKYVPYAFGCVLLFTWLDYLRFMQQSQQRSMVIYDIYGESNTDFLYGKSGYLLGTVNDKTQYVVNQTRLQKGCNSLENLKMNPMNLSVATHRNLKVIVWLGKTIIFIEQPFPERTEFSQPINADYLVVSNDAVRHLEEITPAFNFTELIIDSSNRYFTVRQLLQEAEAKNIEAYAVSDRGAYVVNFF